MDLLRKENRINGYRQTDSWVWNGQIKWGRIRGGKKWAREGI